MSDQLMAGNIQATVQMEEIHRRQSFRWVNVVGPLVVLAVALGIWEYMHRWGLRSFFDKPGFLVPSPVTVIDQSFVDATSRSDMLTGLRWTALAAFIGLAIAIVLGVGLALLMASASWVERSIYPYLVALQAIPVLAIVPIIYVIFGGGMSARLYVCVMISLFPIVSNTLFGLLSADQLQHDLFTLQGVSRWTRLRRLQLPAALPSMFNGFRIAAGLSVIGVVDAGHRHRDGAIPHQRPLPAGVRRPPGRLCARHRGVLLLRLAQPGGGRPVAPGHPLIQDLPPTESVALSRPTA
jgi:NitT/TauT family transport system permease protein